MDINELKTAWNKYSEQEVNKHRLGKQSIHDLLKKQTQTLVDRIDRNIRIGLAVLGLYVAYLVIDYFFLTDYFSKMVTNTTVEYPKWLEPIDVFSTVIIITTYLFFVIRYFRIRKSFSVNLQLKNLLIGIHETLITYRRMFYLAVTVLLINFLIAFIAGVYQGIHLGAPENAGVMATMPVKKMLMLIGVSILVVVPSILALFFALRWGFNKLYGQYLAKITDTLRELDESDNQE